jgi:hypothetical protein
MRMLRRRGLAALTGCLLSLAFLGLSAPPASASGTPICNISTGYCLNSPGAGNNVIVVSSGAASYTPVDGTAWIEPNGTVLPVWAYMIGNGPDCLTWNGTTEKIYAAVCNMRAAQEWYYDSALYELVNEYATVVHDYNHNWFMCAATSRDGALVGISDDLTALCGWESSIL